MKNWSMHLGAVVSLSVAALSGCSAAPFDDPAYKAGALGNGRFAFKCDDAIACQRWTNNAANFPQTVSLGSTWDVGYEATESGTGLVVEAEGPFVTRGPDGFTAIHAGIASLVTKNASGQVFDYTTITVVAPDDLVVYEASQTDDNPPHVTRIALKAGERASYRVFAESAKETLAGSVKVEWTSNDRNVIDVESYRSGVVNLVAQNMGSTTLKVEAAALHEILDVQVTP